MCMHAHIITKQRPMQREAESRYVQTCLWFSPNLDFNAVFPKFQHTSMHHRVYSTLRKKKTTVQRENFGKGFSLTIWRFWITLPVCQYLIPSCSQPHRYGWPASQFTAQSIYYSSASQVKKSAAVMVIYKYFTREDRFVLSTVHTCGDSSLSKREVDKVTS